MSNELVPQDEPIEVEAYPIDSDNATRYLKDIVYSALVYCCCDPFIDLTKLEGENNANEQR